MKSKGRGPSRLPSFFRASRVNVKPASTSDLPGLHRGGAVGPSRTYIWIFIGGLGILAVLSYIAVLAARPRESTPEQFWRGGIFYVNSDDPAIFVQKRIGIGYTLNFGNRWSWVILGFVLAMAAVPLLWTAISIGNLRHTIPAH